MAFNWPSRAPLGGWPDGTGVPPKGVPIDDYTVRLDPGLTVQATTARRYDLADLTQHDEVLRRDVIKPGLERITPSSAVPFPGRPNWYLYVATGIKGLDGKPPELGCTPSERLQGARTTMPWKGLLVLVRFSGSHCDDWPEIYEEIIHVLGKLQEVKP